MSSIFSFNIISSKRIDAPFDVDYVVCDYSGMLVDDRKPVHEAHNLVMDMYGLPKVAFDDWISIAPRCVGAKDVYANMDIDEDLDEMVSNYSRFYEQTRKRFPPVPNDGVLETLSYLKSSGKKLAVISAHPHDALVSELKQFGYYDYFSFVLGGVEDKRRHIVELSEKERVSLDRICYIGDTNKDIHSAMDAGVIAIGKVGGYVNEEVLDNTLSKLDRCGHPNYKIFKLTDLMDCII